MTELNPLTKIFRRGADQEQPERRWNCPSDGRIAAYLDSALGESERTRVQEHLAGCAHCRSLVSDLVKQGRVTDVSETPAALLERVHALVPTKPKLRAWTWVPVAAGVLASAAIVVMVLEKPQRLTVPEWPAPSAPALLESKPAIPPAPSRSETVRKANSFEHSPTIISPQPDSVVPPGQLEFRWNAVPDSMYYQIRVLTPEGDLVWEGDLTATHTEWPKLPTLNRGKYYVLVSAMLKNGRAAKSSPVNFQVADSE